MSNGLLRTVHLANCLSLSGVGAVGSYVKYLANGLSLSGAGAVGSYVLLASGLSSCFYLHIISLVFEVVVSQLNVIMSNMTCIAI